MRGIVAEEALGPTGMKAEVSEGLTFITCGKMVQMILITMTMTNMTATNDSDDDLWYRRTWWTLTS